MSSYAALHKAIADRWNDAGLNATYGTLYPFGGTGTRSVSAVISNVARVQDKAYWPGSPQETAFPRAEYEVDFDSLEIRTANSDIKTAPAIFNVFVKTHLTASQALDSMCDGLVDSESADVDPIDMPCAKGGIVAVDHLSAAVIKVGSNIHLAQLRVEVTWSEPR